MYISTAHSAPAPGPSAARCPIGGGGLLRCAATPADASSRVATAAAAAPSASRLIPWKFVYNYSKVPRHCTPANINVKGNSQKMAYKISFAIDFVTLKILSTLN